MHVLFLERCINLLLFKENIFMQLHVYNGYPKVSLV